MDRMDGWSVLRGEKQLNGSTQKDKYTTFAIPQSK